MAVQAMFERRRPRRAPPSWIDLRSSASRTRALPFSALSPARRREGGEKAFEIVHRQTVDAAGSRATAAAEATAQLIGARWRRERRAHADRVLARALQLEH